jgi:hypothetical protein
VKTSASCKTSTRAAQTGSAGEVEAIAAVNRLHVSGIDDQDDPKTCSYPDHWRQM